MIVVRVADFDRINLTVALDGPTYRSISERDRQGRTLTVGDLLLEKSGGGDGQPVGAVVLYDDPRPAVCSNFIARIEPADGMCPRYWCYLHSSAYAARLNVRSIKQTSGIQNLDQSSYLDELVPYPPLVEQAAIAAFLDRETAKIDALVDGQRRLIELLREKRQAIISHVVTRGLDPKVPMKGSGADWLGDVPAHWEVRTVAKASTKITNGYVGPTRDILVADGVPYIQATHIKNGRINFDDEYFVTPEWSATHAKSVLDEGDVLIVQTGAGTGDVGLVSNREAGFNCHALIIITSEPSLLVGAFLAAVLQSSYGQQKLASIQTGAMHPHLNCGEVKFVEIPIPPIVEQIEIVEHIRNVAGRFDALSGEARQAIALLDERRAVLISAAVTGKIDVRGLVEATSEGQAA
jgi:type I restriction enzyme S subunit